MRTCTRLAIVLGILLTVVAPAATIYDNGVPDSSLFGTQMSEYLVGDDFTLNSTFNVTSIRFWSQQLTAGAYTGSVYWAIYSNGTLEPNAIVQGGVTAALTGTATGNSGFGYTEYVFDIPVSFQLTANTYWLTLHNGPLATTAASEMLWSATSNSGTASVYRDLVNAPTVWISNVPTEQAFQLMGPDAVGTIPEPSSFLLLASGVFAGTWLCRKRSPFSIIFKERIHA